MQAGHIVTVIGPNGAGKTTLLAALMGLLPSKGESRYEGQDLRALITEERVRRGICLVPERRELFTEMTVADNLILGAYTRWKDRAAVQRDLQDVYARFPRLLERRGQLAGTLSGGERQMLALGRALMAKPQLLLLDEPSLGLAPLIVREIFRIVIGLRELGVSILLVEQNARAALETADYGYVLETGSIVHSGPAASLAHDPRVDRQLSRWQGGLIAMDLSISIADAMVAIVRAGRSHAAGDADPPGRAICDKGRWSPPATRHGPTPPPARPRRALPAHCAPPASRPEDRVAIICSNRIEFLEILLGCAWLGAIAVPINVASRGPQLQHILSNCGARLLVMEGAYAENLTYLDASTLAVEAIWLIGAAADVRIGRHRRDTAMPPGGEKIASAAVRPGDPALILYTSGTTGPSKGVCCPHAQYFWWGVNTASLLQLRDDDMLCTSLPLFHTNALNTFYQALLIGSHVRYEKRFSASGFYRVAHASAGRPSPTCSAPWCRSCCRGRRRRKKPRTRCGSRSRPACRRSFTTSSPGAPGFTCSTAGDRPKQISCSARRSSVRSPA